jgi:signal transduction histidine kinase
MIKYDVINALLTVILLFNTALLLPFLRNIKNNVQTFVYSVNIITILLWVVTMMGYRSQGEYVEEWLRALYTVAIFIGVTYMQFTFVHPFVFRRAKYIIYAVNGIAFFAAYLVTLTNTIIVEAVTRTQEEPQIVFGQGYPFYIVVILVPFIIGFARQMYLIYKYNAKVTYLLVGYFISANVAFVTNLMLPWMGIFVLNWVGQFFTVIMVSLTTYSILKFNVMNIKFFAINVGVIFLLIVTFAQMLFADSMRNLLISGLVFFISSITGWYLILLNRNERKSFENIVELNAHIKKINDELKNANIQLRSLDKLKSEFISLASHQLRSPLTVIKGYASTLNDGIVGELTPKQSEIVKHIYGSADGLAHVVEDFLNVTKIEQGGMQYDFVTVNLYDVVETVSQDMKIAANNKKLELSTEFSKSKEYIVTADVTKIKQVFINIIDNSIKYTKEGTIIVRLQHGKKENTVEFSVTDTGSGFSKETKKRLFTKFSRGDAASLNGGGSGLGLYLAYEIVKAHHGDIFAESAGVNKGARFTVSLPLNKTNS